jgi:glycosyltransferase involved in cell wall biosynthesis
LVCNWRDTAHPRSGGAEVYTEEILKRWAAQHHQVTLFASAVKGRPSVETADGIRVVRSGGKLGVYRRARQYAQRHQGSFDVIVDEINTRPFGAPRWAGNTPVVALIHQVAAEVWATEMHWSLATAGRYLLEPWWLRPYHDLPVVTPSASSRASLEAMGLRRVQVVGVGISVPSALPTLPKEPVPTTLFVGRLTANKRPGDAIAAHHMLRATLPNAQLWIVGTGPLESVLRAGAGEGVTFFGRVDEAHKFELMSRAHLLIMTSVREGWGLVVDEAAAVGTATVGYDVAGLRDSVPAAGGALIEPRPDALAAHLAAVLPGVVDAGAPRTGWPGGARNWDAVADAVLNAVYAALRNAASADSQMAVTLSPTPLHVGDIGDHPVTLVSAAIRQGQPA